MERQAGYPAAAVASGPGSATENRAGFAAFLVFTSSYLLHFTRRVPALGEIRFDMLVGLAVAALLLLEGRRSQDAEGTTGRWLLALCVYVILTLPLVRWPGSVLREGLPEFARAAAFFLFASRLIRTENQLRRFIVVYVVCQTLRFGEPLYLHIVDGYWGSWTYMGDDVAVLQRLAGGPSDVVNPNGLAFIIVSMIPFYYYFLRGRGVMRNGLFVVVLGSAMYALLLTGSRSGFLALIVVMAGIIVEKKRLGIPLLFMGGILVLAIGTLSPLQRERFLSIASSSAHGASTASGRIEALGRNLDAALAHPLFGSGLGTSPESNYWQWGNSQRTHNLYIEVFQEVGIVGFVLFGLFLKGVLGGYWRVASLPRVRQNDVLRRTTKAATLWCVMNLFFSVFSYGLSSYEWYLFGGLSCSLGTIARRE